MNKEKKHGSKPFILTLKSHLRKIISIVNSEKYRMIPYGGGNPYSYCASCKKSVIDISIKGHGKDCLMPKYERIERKLTKRYRKELKRFLKEEEYNQKRFALYIRNKQLNRIWVEGEQELLKEIKSHLDKNSNLSRDIFDFYGIQV